MRKHKNQVFLNNVFGFISLMNQGRSWNIFVFGKKWKNKNIFFLLGFEFNFDSDEKNKDKNTSLLLYVQLWYTKKKGKKGKKERKKREKKQEREERREEKRKRKREEEKREILKVLKNLILEDFSF